MDADHQEKATLSYPSQVPDVAAEDTNMDPPANATEEQQQQPSDITEEQQPQQQEATPAPDAHAAAKEEQEEKDKEEITDGKEESHPEEKKEEEEVVTTMPTDQEQDEAAKHALNEASASPTAPTITAPAADQDPMDVMETSVDTFATAPSNAENQDTEEYTPMEGVTHQDDTTAAQAAPAPAPAAVDDAPPFLSAPASWQIPVAALHQQQQKLEPPQHPQPTMSTKATIRKERYESRVKENKYDIEAWTWLINEAQQTGDLEVIRDMYERFLNVFPTSVSVEKIKHVCVCMCVDMVPLLAKTLACLPRTRIEILQL
ncbi:hypothetical protein FB192DRAFT_1072452 [Mucor lusitanicus]|uniref:Uncharacterized protein n=1 Tax=Mucor circinelloides f. lusitanicus TaxID=29924 RepID=A0A8H4F1X6_MUCCL|nr:hypothetical protein FB192DRAFT_1072452 [Mucor lusitanicus]